MNFWEVTPLDIILLFVEGALFGWLLHYLIIETKIALRRARATRLAEVEYLSNQPDAQIVQELHQLRGEDKRLRASLFAGAGSELPVGASVSTLIEGSKVAA